MKMSIIVPAGNKNVDWSPKEEEKLVKTASAKDIKAVDVKEEVNYLYEAAKSFIEASDKCKECNKPKNLCECKKEEKETKQAGIIPGVPDGTGPHGMGPEKGRGKGPCGKGGKDDKKDDKETSKDDKKDVIEVDIPEEGNCEDDLPFVVEPVAEKASEATKMESAVDKIEEAVIELKEVVQEEKGETEEVAEVEFEVGDDKAPEIPGEEISNNEIIVESTPDVNACAKTKKDVAMDKSASTEEEFCRFAKLSPENRKKLANYWVNMLGFPKDYVGLMVKDYEK